MYTEGQVAHPANIYRFAGVDDQHDEHFELAHLQYIYVYVTHLHNAVSRQNAMYDPSNFDPDHNFM